MLCARAVRTGLGVMNKMLTYRYILDSTTVVDAPYARGRVTSSSTPRI